MRYVETVIVIMPTAVTTTTISLVTYPRLNPNEINIKENSLICANAIPVNKLVLLLYPINAINVKIINCFNSSTNNDNKIIGHINSLIESKTITNPKLIKNIAIKKSLSG